MNLRIVDYQPEYQLYFEKFNKEWLEEYFNVEPIDQQVLENPQKNILDTGGQILFALDGDRVVGTAALKPVEPGITELTKMAVDKQMRGFGIGKILCMSAIEKAKTLGNKKLILYSSTKLENAIAIYRKLGFLEIPSKKGIYGRADIMMELDL